MSAIEIILVGALGSAFQELLHWYELREHLTKPSYLKLIRSVGYWVVTALMILGSGVAVMLWFAGDEGLSARHYLVMGAALPLIFKKAVEAVGASKPSAPATRAGRAPAGTLSAYFRTGGAFREERLA